MNRFVIRLLLSAVSLAPVLCWAAEPSTDQASVIAEIQKLGGVVSFDQDSPGKLVVPSFTSRDAMWRRRVGAPEGIDPTRSGCPFGHPGVTDAGLANLRGLLDCGIMSCLIPRWAMLGWRT